MLCESMCALVMIVIESYFDYTVCALCCVLASVVVDAICQRFFSLVPPFSFSFYYYCFFCEYTLVYTSHWELIFSHSLSEVFLFLVSSLVRSILRRAKIKKSAQKTSYTQTYTFCNFGQQQTSRKKRTHTQNVDVVSY